MTPTFQTVFGVPLGNCFPACLASLLERPLSDFPFPPYEEDWLRQVDRALAPLGWAYVEWPADKPFAWTGRFLCLVHGQSPRGFKHSVIAEHSVDDGLHSYRWVHDPHPDGGWVRDIEGIGVLVPTHLPNAEAVRPAVAGTHQPLVGGKDQA